LPDAAAADVVIGIIAGITLLLLCKLGEEGTAGSPGGQLKKSKPETSTVGKNDDIDGLHGPNEFTNNLNSVAMLLLLSSGRSKLHLILQMLRYAQTQL
jgi:hypothetical protein